MTTRVESAAATRRALLQAAGRLLDEGGPDAVTLRAVGAVAGVSRGAPYGHFDDKAHLLTALAAEGWTTLAARLADFRDDASLAPVERLLRASRTMVALGVEHRSLYELMFTHPDTYADLLLTAAGEAQDVYLDLVRHVVGSDAARPIGALLLAGIHGIAGLAAAGHLGTPKWGIDADDLLRLLIDQTCADSSVPSSSDTGTAPPRPGH